MLALALASTGCASPFHRQWSEGRPTTAHVEISPKDTSNSPQPVNPTEVGQIETRPAATDTGPLSPDPSREVSAESVVKPVVFSAVSSRQANELIPGGLQQPVMTLADFESLAMANNPTIQQLAATTQKAAGYRQQVGLWANPVAGYQGVQLADNGTDQHTAFVEQEFVTAGKLGLNSRVLNEAVRAQLLELEAQKYRVQTDVASSFTPRWRPKCKSH